MRFVRPLLVLSLGSVVALTILTLGLRTFVKSQTPIGCPVISTNGLFDPAQTVAIWQNRTLTPPVLAENPELSTKVLGVQSDEKWIEVNLTTQKLTAHQGNQVYIESLISSGLWNSTPVGEYRIWYKIRATKMEGGSKLNNTYYYLPNVPYAMFFYGDYGIHGTYWHSNFGQPMSHGCVNTPTPIAEKLFYWVDPQLPDGKWLVSATKDNPGTRVVIHK